MMNVVVFHGSAHRNGDTDTLAEHFLRGMNEAGQHKVTHFIPIDMMIAHCRACMQCMNGSGCVIQDDMQSVYPALQDADVVVLATPMFWGYMTSQLKTLFDRLEAVVSADYFGNKDFVLLIGYRHYFGSIIEWLERITSGFESKSHVIACQTFDPTTAKDRPIRHMPGKLDETYQLGYQIATTSA
jgi:multimeric flavodoxin WrbA